MANKIIMVLGQKKIGIELDDSDISKSIISSLPIISDANKWGSEIYFSIHVESELEEGIEKVEIGDVAYWPPGKAFCVFFGRTPASIDEKPMAASPVTVIGKVSSGGIKELKEIKEVGKVEIVLP